MIITGTTPASKALSLLLPFIEALGLKKHDYKTAIPIYNNWISSGILPN